MYTSPSGLINPTCRPPYHSSIFFFGVVVTLELDDEGAFVTVLELDDEEALDRVVVFFEEEEEGTDEVTVVPKVWGRVCVVVLVVVREVVVVVPCVVLAAPMPITLAYESMVLMVLPI